MSIQMNLLGGIGTSRITAQAVSVNAVRLSTATAGIQFAANGQQVTERNGSLTVVGNWVTPTFTSGNWEIRAVLDSGVTPSGDDLGVWLALTSDRFWQISDSVPSLGPQESLLTFEFRRAGATVAEETITTNFLSARALDIV